MNRTFGFLKRAGTLALSAVMSLSLCAPAAMAVEAPAQDAAEYVCGLQEHAHDASCRVVDPVGDLLSSSNYQDGYGVVYIVHQHDAACFDGGRLACVLMDGQYMAGYPDVSIVHKHDEGCTGCTLPSEPYRIGDPAVNKPGAATSNGQVSGPDGDIYIGTGIGAGKDTGDTGVDDDTRTFQFHDHTDCGGDCGLPFVVRYVASASDQEGRIVCGLAEHAHSTTCCKPAAVDKTPVFPSMPSILQSVALERTSTPSRQTGVTAYFVPRAIVSKAYRQGPDLPTEGWGWTLSSDSNPSVIMPVTSGDGWTVNGDGSVSVAARAGAESVWPRIEFSKAGEYEFHISCSTTPRRDGGFLFADGWTLRVAVTGSAGNWSVSGQYVLGDAAEVKPRTDRAEARVMVPGFGGFDANTINRATWLVDEMTAGERAGQLFLAHWPGSVDNAKAMVDNYHVGGFLTFGSFYENLTPELARSNIMSVQSHAVDNGGTSLLFTTDEEGGNVTRVSKYPKYRTRPFDAASVVKSGGEAGIKRDGLEKALFLRSLGLNVNHAPVADMAENGSYIWERTYKAGTADTARYIASAVRGLEQGHIGSTMKHFPGYGKSPDDTHGGTVADSRTRNDLLYNDLIPFYAGMHAGGHSVMVGHTTMNGLGDSVPASLSPSVYSILRDDLGFWGVAMTDDLGMDAVPAGGNSALATLEAGADMVICSNVADGYAAVTGKMASDAAFASSVKDKCVRIVAWKLSMGLMDADWGKTPEARYESSDSVTDIVGSLDDIMAFADGGSGKVTLLVDCNTESTFSFGTNTDLTIDLDGHVLRYKRESGGSLLRIHSQADVRVVGGAVPVDVLSTGSTGWDARNEILRYSSGFWDNGQIHEASFDGMGRIEATGVGHWNNAVLVCESDGSKLSLENVHLSGNNRHTSAAIRQSSITTVRLSGCVISGFKESGIQASCWKPASLSVSGSYIIGNEGYAGAGIRAENTKLHISDTVMAYNSAIGNGGGSGGGMDIRFTDAYGGRFNKDAVHIEDCVFYGNSAISNGGAVCIGNRIVNDVKFSGRTAIIGNSAEKDGGGIWYFRSERTSPGQVSRLSLTGETDISENVASVIGGGIYADVQFDEGFQLVMDGNDVRIQRNRADGFGLNAGGVFLDVMWRSVVLGGKVQVTDNTLSDKNTTVSAKNIRLSDGTICEISRELDPASRISVFTESTKPSIVVASSSVGDVSQELMSRVFVPEREGYKVIGKDTELLFTTGQSFEVPVSMIVDGLVANVGTVSGTYSGGKAYMSFPDVKDFFLPYEIDCVMADGNTHSFGIMDAGSGSDGAPVSVVSSQVVAGDDDQLCVSAGDLLGKRLVYLPNSAAVGSYSYEDMVRTNGFWSVTVRDMLGVIDDTVEDLSKTYYVPSGRGIDLRLPYQKNDRWSWKVEGDVDAFTCDREVDGDHENVVLSNIRTPVTVTRFVMDGAVYTAQYYAYSESIASALSDIPNASPVVDTRGKNVPVNDVNFNPDLLYLRIGASGEVMRNAELKPFYESSRFAYAAAPSLMYADRLYTNGRYETTQLWVLKPGHFAGSVDSEDWDIYDRDALGLDSIHDLALTNDPDSAVDGETIYLWDGATIRFVYEPASGFSDSPVRLYDWDVSYNNDTRASINDELYEMSGSARLAVTNDKSCVKDESIAEAFVSNVDGDKFYINRRARDLDKNDPNYDTLNKSKWWQANYGLLAGTTEAGLPIWRDGVVAVNLLGPDADGKDTPGKTEVENASARFVRNGDLYTMDSVAVTLFDDGKAYDEIRKGGLSSFQHPGRHVSIWTNDFYPLDDLPEYITGKDPKYGGPDTVADKTSPCVSDDGRAHNMFFGMRFRIKFSLPEDYLGDLEYCFYGNETYVVLDQKTVVADLGGVHVSFGQYVDLWDYIEKGDTKEHTLDVIVMDRGGAGSTSWIQFMIPDATFERVSYDNTSSVEVSKAVTGNPVFAKESYRFDVSFTGSSGDPLVSDVTGTVYNVDDTVESTCVISNGNGSLLLKDGQRVVFDGISALTNWSVREASYSDCITSVSVDSDGDMEAGSTGSLSASGLAKAGGGSAVVAYTNSFDNIGNEMPKTGGTGTAMIVVAGLSCLAGAAVLAVRRRGRR